MSEQTAYSISDTKESGRRPHRSAWLAHWIKTNRNTAPETHSYSTSAYEELDYLGRNGLKVPKSAKGVGGIEIKDLSNMNDSLGMSSKSLGNEGRLSSLFKHGQDTDDTQALRPTFDLNIDHNEAVFCKSGIRFPSVIDKVSSTNGTFSERRNYLGEGTSKNPLKWIKAQSSENVNSFSAPKPLQKKFVESSSIVVPYKFNFGKYDIDKGKAAVSSSTSRCGTSNNPLPNSNFRMLEQEHCHGGSHLADVVRETKTVSHTPTDTSMNVCFGEIKSSLLLDAPSTSSRHLSQFGQEWFQKMKKCSLILFNSQSIASEKTKSKKSHHDHYSIQKFPNFVTDVETMRMCTMLDSVEGSHGDCPRFSHTTRSLLITKNDGVDLSKETDDFRSSRVFTNINGNTSSDLHSLPPFSGQGVRFEALSSSTDLEGKRDVKASKLKINDESSADTNTMDLQFNKEKIFHTGTNSSSNKAFNMVSISPAPHIKNLDRPVLPALESLSENSSRTQSLEMDVLLANAEQQPKRKFICLNSKEADLSSSWVKRLKLSSSKSSAQSTESSSLAGNSSYEKMSKYFSRIVKDGIASSAPKPTEHQDKESMLLSKSRDLSKEDEDISVHPTKKDEELLHSHPWIQRWLTNESRTTLRKPEIVAVCQPQSSNSALEVVQNKQFPSIAAMALMGKVMGGFQQCELQKKGSFTVWKTKSF